MRLTYNKTNFEWVSNPKSSIKSIYKGTDAPDREAQKLYLILEKHHDELTRISPALYTDVERAIQQCNGNWMQFYNPRKLNIALSSLVSLSSALGSEFEGVDWFGGWTDEGESISLLRKIKAAGKRDTGYDFYDWLRLLLTPWWLLVATSKRYEIPFEKYSNPDESRSFGVGEQKFNVCLHGLGWQIPGLLDVIADFVEQNTGERSIETVKSKIAMLISALTGAPQCTLREFTQKGAVASLCDERIALSVLKQIHDNWKQQSLGLSNAKQQRLAYLAFVEFVGGRKIAAYPISGRGLGHVTKQPKQLYTMDEVATLVKFVEQGIDDNLDDIFLI